MSDVGGCSLANAHPLLSHNIVDVHKVVVRGHSKILSIWRKNGLLRLIKKCVGSDKGKIGKVGKVSNVGPQQRQVSNAGAVGDGSDKGNVGKIGKVSNVGAVDHSNDR